MKLEPGMVLYEPEKTIEHVYFLNGALVSIISTNSEGSTVEIGLVGNEGVVGVPAILGGVALKGGRGHVFGVLAAVVALVLLDNAFNLLGFNTNIQAIVKGATFVVALMFFIRGRAAEDAG